MNLPAIELPDFAPRAFAFQLPVPLGELPAPDWLIALLRPEAEAPLRPPDELRARVRDVLRGRGYRPTGRGKPSSEYLANAAAEGRLGPINAVVDAGNAASLHSGLPISVVDLARCRGALRIDVPPPGAKYVFNRSGQEIDVAGLPCLFDADGPCANAVKDAQRTKTDAATARVLAIVWGTAAPAGHADAAAGWLGELLVRLGARPDDGRGASTPDGERDTR
ncbi:MAG: phenylalanine--tRNA ligase beta subunit-related protein [Planctomycetota bacterium]